MEFNYHNCGVGDAWLWRLSEEVLGQRVLGSNNACMI
jgi:hypothetical protein